MACCNRGPHWHHWRNNIKLYPNVADPRREKTRQSAPDVVARRLRQDEQYLTVREILSEPSTGAGGMLSRERSDFCRFGFATLGFSLSGAFIRLSQQLNFSAEMPLVLNAKGRFIPCTAQVVWSEECNPSDQRRFFGIGVRFTRMMLHDREFLSGEISGHFWNRQTSPGPHHRMERRKKIKRIITICNHGTKDWKTCI